jgi:uracil-DNA glycosylase
LELNTNKQLDKLIEEIRSCQICSRYLPLGPRPLFQISQQARVLIVGQAPGRKAHESGVPFDDISGDRLRDWLGIEKSVFYDPGKIALLPMGFCFPGSGKSGDLAPRPECAEAWRDKLYKYLDKVELTVILGQYAQNHCFEGKRVSVTERTKSWRNCWPLMAPMPHPSPRNNRWFRQNPWFETEYLPVFRKRVSQVLLK